MKKASNRQNQSPATGHRRPKNNQPIDIAKAKRKSKTTDPVANTTEQSELQKKQHQFLELIREGSSIDWAALLVGSTREAYEKWRERTPGFIEAMAEAREAHRRTVICAFHEADAFARCLIDRIQRDEDAKPHLRLRAALALLRRNGPSDWLPDSIEADPDDTDPETPEPDLGEPDLEEPDLCEHEIPDAEIPCYHFEEQETPNPQATRPAADLEPHPERRIPPEEVTEPKRRVPSAQVAEPQGRAPAAHVTGPERRIPPESIAEPEAPVPSAQFTEQATVHPKSWEKQPSEARPPQPPTTQSAPVTPNRLRPQDSTPEARSRTTEAGQAVAARAATAAANPDIPDIRATTKSSVNYQQNQRHITNQTTPADPPKFSNHPDIPQTNQPSEARPPQPPATASAPATPNQFRPKDLSPDPGNRAPDPVAAGDCRHRLDTAFFSRYTVHKHESRADFDRLFQQLVHSHAPATPDEELAVFRISQKHWVLRRIETMERAVADSTVNRVRSHHPLAAAAGALALQFLRYNETQESLFFDRMSKLRTEHEKALDRLTSLLETKQHRRKQREFHRDTLRAEHRIANPDRSGFSRAEASLESKGRQISHSNFAGTSG